MEEFKYLGVLFMSERRMEQEINRRCSVCSNANSLLVCSGEEIVQPKKKKKKDHNYKRLIFIFHIGLQLLLLHIETRVRVRVRVEVL